MTATADQIPVALTAFAEAGAPRLLFITHAWGGGVEQHVAMLATLISNRTRVMTLRPFDENSVEIELSGHERFRLTSTDWNTLQGALKALQFDRVHLHHIHGLPPGVLDLDLALEIPLDCTLHDYTSICPQYQLADPDGRYCGEPDAAGCNRCIEGRPHAWRLTISEWREAFSRVLARADRVFAPNLSVVRKIRRYFPSVDVICLPHPERSAKPPYVVKVALLGALSNAKGLAVALSVAAHAKNTKSPLLLRLIGHAAEPLPPELAATGSYQAEDLPKLIASERPDVIWLPSQVPETFSFTLSAALASALPIVASNMGALADRLRGVPNATLLAYNATTADWHDALMKAARHLTLISAARTTSNSRGDLPTANSIEAYAEQYLKALPNAATAASAASIVKLLETGRIRVALSKPVERPLLNVFRIGVYGGHQPSTEVVERALEALAPGETDVVGRTQYQVVEEELVRVQQLVADHQDLLVVKQEQLVAAIATLQISLQAAFDNTMDAVQTTHTQESERWRAILDDADERAHSARAYIAHLEALVVQLQIHHTALDAQRVAMLSSSSWLITRPLRVLARSARRVKHVAHSTIQLIPRVPALTRGGVARFRRGGWRSVQDRLASEFRPPDIPVAMKLPESIPVAIASLTLQSSASEPLVSILIPVYGQHETTFACLKSIAEHRLHRAFEVIVMDDCSPEPAAEALAQVHGIRIIRNETNLGFIGNVNAAAAHARGQWLIILNNDTVVRQGALDALLNTFDEHHSVGLVGAKLLNADGSVQEAGGIVWRDGSAWNWGRGQHRDDPRFNFVRDADFCSGAALAISRQLFTEMGGFDALYTPAYYEDADLAFRIRARGLRVLYQPAAEIFHIEGVSHGRDESSGIKSYQRANARKFFKRWQQILSAHRENAAEPSLEAHRVTRSNILVVEACMVTPDQDAGSVRMVNMLRIMRNEGHHVTFIADNLDGNPKYAAILTRMGIEVLHGQYAGSVRKVLRDRGPTLHAIIFCRYYIATQYVSNVRALAPQALIIFDTVDLHFVREQREAQLLGNAAMVRSAALTRAKELAVIDKSDVTIVVSAVEKALLAKIKPSARIDIVSLINTPISIGAPYAERSGILFIGGFRHAPNVDAIKWFASEVFPIVRRLLPDVVTTVVGSNMPDDVAALSQEGFHVLGFVEDTNPLLGSTRVSIAPLRYGAGIKGKINEAMNHGIPVVATECAIEGMQLVSGRDVLVADDANDFALAIVRLHNDAALWDKLSSAGRANVHAHFSPDAARPAIRALLIR